MEPVDANTLYYAFSTIAQAGAGAFAFFSAFVLYRLQSVDQRMSAAAIHIAEQTRLENALSSARGYIAGRQYDLLLESFGAAKNVIENNPALLASWNLLLHEKQIAAFLVSGFKKQIWPTVLILGFSVASICVVTTLVKHPCVAVIPIAVLSLSFIGLLVFQANLLRKCLTD